jgi:hypothetical protein
VYAEAGLRVRRHIRELLFNHDRSVTAVGKQALTGLYSSLSSGIIERNLDAYREEVHAEEARGEQPSVIV